MALYPSSSDLPDLDPADRAALADPTPADHPGGPWADAAVRLLIALLASRCPATGYQDLQRALLRIGLHLAIDTRTHQPGALHVEHEALLRVPCPLGAPGVSLRWADAAVDLLNSALNSLTTNQTGVARHASLELLARRLLAGYADPNGPTVAEFVTGFAEPGTRADGGVAGGR